MPHRSSCATTPSLKNVSADARAFRRTTARPERLPAGKMASGSGYRTRRAVVDMAAVYSFKPSLDALIVDSFPESVKTHFCVVRAEKQDFSKLNGQPVLYKLLIILDTTH